MGGVNYLMMLGYLTGGWLMARSAGIAADAMGKDGADTEFLAAKRVTADTFITHSLPQVLALARTILAGDEAVLAMQPAWLAE